VLELTFLKYASDAFEERRQELRKHFLDPDHDYYIPQDDMSNEEFEALIEEKLEVRDYFLAKNVFWVPPLARWEVTGRSGKTYEQNFKSWFGEPFAGTNIRRIKRKPLWIL
jgi:type I restriction-modification system DNA methylase subunit